MATADQWNDFRSGDSDPIGIEELKRRNLEDMPEDAFVFVMDIIFRRRRYGVKAPKVLRRL
jgi:hypothetical protein